MLTKKLIYAVNHPKIMLDSGIYRLSSLFGQQDYRKFIVLTQGRSGSNMLISMLNSHPKVHAKGELFHRLYGQPAERVLTKIYGTHPAQIQAVGFKIFYYHPLDEPVTRVWDLLTQIEDLHVIHLKRRNLLRLVLSKKIAEQTDSWVNRDGSPEKIAVHQKQVTFSVQELETEFSEIHEVQRRFGGLFQTDRMITSYYEEIAANPTMEMRRITDLLGLEPSTTKATVKRQNPERLPSLILNYHELKRAFRGTAWEPFFED